MLRLMQGHHTQNVCGVRAQNRGQSRGIRSPIDSKGRDVIRNMDKYMGRIVLQETRAGTRVKDQCKKKGIVGNGVCSVIMVKRYRYEV